MSLPPRRSTGPERRISSATFRGMAKSSGAIHSGITSPSRFIESPIPLARASRQFCSRSAATQRSQRTLDGKNIILQNGAPGQLGTLGLNPIYGPCNWNFDANLEKEIRVAESRSVAIRLDARNIFNHPTPGTPNLNINSGTFGQITTKTGSRTLAGQIRLEF